MAVNEKPVRATDWTTHGGKLYPPGSVLTGRMPDHAIRGAMESGVATDVAVRADSAAKAEAERKADVERQIATRSEKRKSNESN